MNIDRLTEEDRESLLYLVKEYGLIAIVNDLHGKAIERFKYAQNKMEEHINNPEDSAEYSFEDAVMIYSNEAASFGLCATYLAKARLAIGDVS